MAIGVDQYLLENYFPDFNEAKTFAIDAQLYLFLNSSTTHMMDVGKYMDAFIDSLENKTHLEIVRSIRTIYYKTNFYKCHLMIVEKQFCEFYNFLSRHKKKVLEIVCEK